MKMQNMKYAVPWKQFFISLQLMSFVLYSMTMSFIAGQVVEYVMSIFNQRKMVLIVSEKTDQIASQIMGTLKRGVTF